MKHVIRTTHLPYKASDKCQPQAQSRADRPPGSTTMSSTARHLTYNFSFMAVILLLKFGESVDSGSDGSSHNYDHYYGNASVKLLRFRDFEPRQQSEGAGMQSRRLEDLDGSREARGFHFHASGEDVSVEMEFIVPFLKVPVQRSLSLARAAVSSIMNLRLNALVNTVVVVAAGAIIAAVVRLVLAPIVVGSYGYAQRQKERDDDVHQNNSYISRSMRSLTDVVESQLDEHNIDMSACAQRYICQYLQRNAMQVRSRGLTVESPAKLIDALVNVQWLDAYLNDTAVFKAIGAARGGRDCSHIYRSCQWPQLNMQWLQALPHLLQYFNG